MPAKPQLDFLVEYTKESVAKELRRLAEASGTGTVTKDLLRERGRCSYETVRRLFGTLRAGLEYAGVRSQRFMKATDRELLDILVAVWLRSVEDFGRSPEKADLRRYGFPLSDDTITRRFGSWRKALLKAYKSIEGKSDEDVPIPAPVKPRARRALSIRKRFLVLKRDNFTCRLCGASGVPLHVDHVVPVAKSGSDSLANLQTACVDCNLGKRDSLQ